MQAHPNDIRWQGPTTSRTTVIIAPGDEGRLEDAAPTQIASGLAAAGFRVARFACPGGPLADRDRRQAVVMGDLASACSGKVVLAGFSRGARVSAGLVGTLGAQALVLFAYPFHARTDPDPHGRVEALRFLSVPVLLFQGTRDSHGNEPQVRGYRLDNVRTHWMRDANHALRPRASSGFTQAEQLDEAVHIATTFIHAL